MDTFQPFVAPKNVSEQRIASVYHNPLPISCLLDLALKTTLYIISCRQKLKQWP